MIIFPVSQRLPWTWIMNPRCYLSISHYTLAKVGTLVYSTIFSDLSFIVHRLVHEIRIHLIQVWRVTLEPDDQNHRSRLSATFLSSFPREDYGDVCSLSLLGTSVAFGVGSEFYKPHLDFHIAIVNWATIQNPSHRRHASSLSYMRKYIYCRPVS